jgi:peptidoglycan/xylan/chitin deacetylase (PgdA/CDA1 family)
MTLKMRDLELYVEGKVQIRENSVVLTIDDGNSTIYTMAQPVIEKYGVNVTVFAITSWDSNVLSKQTDLIEIHSHTHGMHVTGKCRGGQGGLFKCVDYEEGLQDLKTSREILNNTTYLAYPFGEYTDLSIQLLKDAGYTMALTTNYGNAKVGDNKYLIPRIYIYNQYTLDTFKRLVN